MYKTREVFGEVLSPALPTLTGEKLQIYFQLFGAYICVYVCWWSSVGVCGRACKNMRCLQHHAHISKCGEYTWRA